MPQNRSKVTQKYSKCFFSNVQFTLIPDTLCSYYDMVLLEKAKMAEQTMDGSLPKANNVMNREER